MQKPENAGWLCTVTTSKITFVFYVEEKKFFVKRRHQGGGGGSKVCMERDKGGGDRGSKKPIFKTTSVMESPSKWFYSNQGCCRHAN